MLDPKRYVIACTAEADVPRGEYVPPGVKPGPCAGCGRRVMLSPSTRDNVASGRFQAACWACAAAHVRGRPLGGGPCETVPPRDCRAATAEESAAVARLEGR